MRTIVICFLIPLTLSFAREQPGALSAKLVKAVELNEALKKAVAADAPDYTRKRASFESYYQKEIAPSYGAIAKAAPVDASVGKAFLGFIASFENGADEQAALTLAKVFRANPEALEKNLRAMSESDRKRVRVQLEAGWQNLLYGKKKSPEDNALEKRISTLGS